MRIKPLHACLALAALFALGCGSAPKVTAPGAADEKVGEVVAEDRGHKPVAVSMGQPIKVDADGYQATYTLSKPQMLTRSEWDSEPDNGVWLVAYLQVRVAKGETYACSCNLSLVEKGGKVRDTTYVTFPGKPMFEAVGLRAGQNNDGWVVWDLPKDKVDDAQVQLKVDQVLSTAAYGYWSVKA